MAEEPNISCNDSRRYSQCGAQLGPEARFCPDCGTTADAPKDPEAPEAPVPFTTPEVTAPQVGHRFHWSQALNPEGRFNRMEFLLLTFGTFLATVFLLTLARPLGIVCLLFAIYIVIVAFIRRFHDLNRSGWYALLALVPIVSFAVLAVLLFFPSARGPNRWGT